MKAISIPFRFESSPGVPASSAIRGPSASTTDVTSAAKQKIVDVLATRPYERVMRPEYGAAISNLLFEPLDPLIFADYKIDVLKTLNENVSDAYIRDIQIQEGDPMGYNGEGDSTLDVRVLYDVAGQGTDIFSFTVDSTQIITEETPI